jgi:hypothetical protein
MEERRDTLLIHRSPKGKDREVGVSGAAAGSSSFREPQRCARRNSRKDDEMTRHETHTRTRIIWLFGRGPVFS